MKPDISTFAKFEKESKKRVSISRIPKGRSEYPWSVSSVTKETGAGDMTWKVVYQGSHKHCQATYRTEIIRQGYWLLHGGIRCSPNCWVIVWGGPQDVLRKMWREAKG